MVGDGSYDDGADKNMTEVVVGIQVKMTGASILLWGYWSPELYFKNSVKMKCCSNSGASDEVQECT